MAINFELLVEMLDVKTLNHVYAYDRVITLGGRKVVRRKAYYYYDSYYCVENHIYTVQETGEVIRDINYPIHLSKLPFRIQLKFEFFQPKKR